MHKRDTAQLSSLDSKPSIMDTDIGVEVGASDIFEGQQRIVKILLLEDLAFDAELILQQLRTAGLSAETKCVASRSDFLSALVDFKPDLVLSDYNLPNMTGLEALTFVKEKCA